MSKTLLIFGLIAVLTAQTTLARSYSQWVGLYKDWYCGSLVLTFTNQDVPNLDTSHWNNAIYSVKVTGTWLFYDHDNYNTGSNASMEYVSDVNQYSCHHLNSTGGKLTSVRSAGDKNDYRLNSLTLYKEEYFQDQEEFTNGDLAYVKLRQHKSLIVTGNSTWTLYDQPGYGGNAICVNCVYPEPPTSFKPLFISNIVDELKVPFNSIRSIRLGCDGVKGG